MKKFFVNFLSGTLTCLVFFVGAIAQTAPQLVKLTPPSPSVQAMQKYGDIPVSPYTGVPDISIPIYTIKYKDITIPISVSYHASGIKVTEEASNVGLGWALNAGGTISRNIIGSDDFVSGAYFFTTGGPRDFVNGQGPTNAVNKGCSLNYFDIHGTPTNFNYDVTTYLQNSTPVVDFQPDRYYYSYPGHSGKFVMTRNWQVPAILQKQESIQIKCLAADGSTWQIISADGYIYDYTIAETYSDFTVHKSAWYLTKITSPLGNIVTFGYTPISGVRGVDSYTESRDDAAFPPTSQPTTLSGWQHGVAPANAYSSQILTSINFTNGQVSFNYSARTDITNDLKLDNVTITAQGAAQPFKTVAFTYDYFVGNTDISYTTGFGNTTNRLKLTQITETGTFNGQSIQNPPYIFTYNEPVGLPAKTSFARDHWGYFNNVTGRGTLIPDPVPINSSDPIIYALGLTGLQREPNPNYTSVFSLASIKYPAGGWTEFQYESNDYDEANSEVNDHTYFEQILGQTTPVQKSIQFIYNASTHQYTTGTTLDITNIYISGTLPVPVTLSAYFRFTGPCNTVTGGNSGLIYFELVPAGGGSVSHVDPFALSVCNGSNSPCVGCQAGMPIFSYQNSYQLSPGVYTWRAFVGTSGAALQLQDMGATYSWYESSIIGGRSTGIQTGGGIRIKRIIDHDGVNESNNKTRRYVYHYFADPNNTGNLTEFSYGRRMSKPQYAFFVPSLDDNSIYNGGTCTAVNYFVMHLNRVGDSYNPLNGSAAGAAVGYDQVTELIGENGEFGKKIYKYYNNPDIVNNFADPFSGRGLALRPPYGSNIVDPLNGSLLNETDYVSLKGNYYKVKETTNQFITAPATENIDYALENRPAATFAHGSCNSYTPMPCDGNNLVLVYRNLQSEWVQQTSTDEKIYNQGGDEAHFLETLTNYFYDNPSHLQLTRTVSTNSKGEQITTTNKYPLDYTVGTPVDAFAQGAQNLINKHIVNVPLEKYITKKKSDGTNIGAISYVLTSYNSSLPSPALAYASMLSAPNTTFTASSISSGSLVKDAAYQPLISFDTYDASGNLTQQHKINDMNHAYLWDYNNSLMIAEVSNAATTEIAYTSFEADGLGGWTLADATRTSLGVTGSQSYTISTGKTISKSGLTSGKNYIVSYWSKNGAITVNGVAAVTGPTKNGWTYYEHLLPTTTTSVSITATSANIDELRLYPSTSLMTTYTYVPVIGITSTCSTNNTIQYYVYDALGRLKQIVDQDGNIIKTIEYHLQNQVGS
ncbi:MAG: hypothetical protein JST75_21555 [Bacteroidetes bacterium]|nr:hypothetical protein [Bacteroidota bacterium]